MVLNTGVIKASCLLYSMAAWLDCCMSFLLPAAVRLLTILVGLDLVACEIFIVPPEAAAVC